MLSTFFWKNIGPSLPKTIPKFKKQFKNVVNNSSLNLFVLEPATHVEVPKLISQLKNWKFVGPTGIKYPCYSS